MAKVGKSSMSQIMRLEIGDLIECHNDAGWYCSKTSHLTPTLRSTYLRDRINYGDLIMIVCETHQDKDTYTEYIAVEIQTLNFITVSLPEVSSHPEWDRWKVISSLEGES